MANLIVVTVTDAPNGADAVQIPQKLLQTFEVNYLPQRVNDQPLQPAATVNKKLSQEGTFANENSYILSFCEIPRRASRQPTGFRW